jgi:hypothetical protein
VITAVGLALIVMPVTFNMFERAPKGATMIAEFRPFMKTDRLDGYQHEIRQINAAVYETQHHVFPYLAVHGTSESELNQQLSSVTELTAQWPSINATMSGLIGSVQANLGNYQAVAALPSFKLFPWFFVLPGVLLVGLAVTALLRPRRARTLRWFLVAIGVGLVLAPAVFQMFGRAPQGGRMMTAFESIETTQKVEQIQNYFGTMAAGQGELRLEVIPLLKRTGLTDAQIAQQFPAVSALDQSWDHILNDMTPMIGVMSDNVANYQAILSLPPFPLFPWFFVIPGLIIIVLGLLVRPRRAEASAGPSDDAPQIPPVDTATANKGAS